MSMINPKDLIGKYSIEEHLKFADDYFEKLGGGIYLLQKPFYHPKECAPSLSNLGQLLGGLNLQYGMNVLDFAAGTCWLSRILVQIGCNVTSCDVSETALKIGRNLFERYPPITDRQYRHNYLVFDGKFIDAPDKSFDRIIVNDAFHHIPNTTEVLAEFNRILKDEGMVGMSEPGRLHSRSPASQLEMQTYQVIENDFVLEDIWEQSRSAGFEYIEVCPVLRQSYMSMDEYLDCISGNVPSHVTTRLAQDTYNHSIFFIHKTDPGRARRVPKEIKPVSEGQFDEQFYLDTYPDVASAIAKGAFSTAWQHYDQHGRDEGRQGCP